MTRAAPRPLPDILAPGLRAVFVGINPSLVSSEVGHHFASPGNPFWRLLHASRLTPALLRPEDDGRLLELGLGLTNVCARPSRSADELGAREYAAGVALLRTKLEALCPAVVALVGVSMARLLLPDGDGSGAGPRRGRFAGARVFVLPNPSGRNAAYPGFDAKLVHFVRLRAYLARRGAGGRSTNPSSSRQRRSEGS